MVNKDIKQELLEEVFKYWKRHEDLTLAEMNEKLIDDYLKENNFYGFDIPNGKLLEWLKKKNK